MGEAHGSEAETATF